MPDLGQHAGFILAAYGITLVAVTALVLAIVADDRHQRHVLAELERKGIRRRSAKAETRSRPRAGPSRKRRAAKTRKRSA